MQSERIVLAARSWIGTPYQHQASCKGAGTDCLGFIRGVWRELYGSEPETPPPYAADWAETEFFELMRDAAQRHMQEIAVGDAGVGDVLLFRPLRHAPARHAAIISGPGRILHACSGHAVREEPIGPWARRIAYAFRFPQEEI